MNAPYHPNIEYIAFATPPYVEALALRERVLRIPIGKAFHPMEIEDEWRQYHFGYRDDRSMALIGVCALKRVDATCVQLRQMAVEEGWRRRGVGSTLVLYCIKWANARGYRSMRLDARHHAVAFYAKMGFKKVSAPFEHLGITHYAMYKDL